MKDFDSWNKAKKQINNKNIKIFCNTREIWWCSLGLNVGSEEDGKNKLFERPVLIIKVFNKNILRVVPLTSKLKKDNHHVPIIFNNIQNAAIISQLKTISIKRLTRKLGRIDDIQFNHLINILRQHLI